MSRYDHPADDSAYEAATMDPSIDRYAEDEDRVSECDGCGLQKPGCVTRHATWVTPEGSFCPSCRGESNEDIQAIDPLALAEGDLVGVEAMMKSALAQASTCSEVALLRSHCQRWEKMFVTLADLAASADDRESQRRG